MLHSAFGSITYTKKLQTDAIECKRMVGWDRTLRTIQKPVGYIVYPNTLVIVRFMPCIGDDELWVSVFDLQKRFVLACECLRPCDIVAYLDIKLFISFYGYKIDLLFVKLADVDFKTSAQEFDTDDILVDPAIIDVPTA